MRTPYRSILIFALSILAPFAATHNANAQVEPIDPVWMVATRETPIRCGELSTFYKVADLERGDVVKVDGRSTRFARVVYPDSLFGFVRVEDAENVTANTLTVSDITHIKAPNQISGLTGSWRSIYLGEIDPSTKLTILGEAKAKDGQMVGYRVKPLQPPAVDHPPHGYVQLVALREATQDEIAAHQARKSGDDASEEDESGDEAQSQPGTMSDDNPARPKPIRENTQTNESGTDEPESQPAQATRPETDDTDDSLVDDMAIPTPDELAETDPEPGADQDATESSPSETNAPADAEQAQPEEPQLSPVEREYLKWEELEDTLSRVRRMGGSTLEDSFDELIAEYERSLPNTESVAIRQAMNDRLDWLRLRKKARDQRLALQAALDEAKDFKAELERERQEWQSTRGYDIVGRLVTSAIYDGKNLPRMYRIVAVGEGGLTRTIGYVRAEPGSDLDSLVGDIVGVSGQSKLDRALKLRVITPTRIDRFRPANQAAAPATDD